ncbi:class I SAM-dependent methyltransferase [Cellulomonas xylanilytica]|uniref:SAM-dependent methyltransferase n=1 Tax=Cellulomonas xylanilytica TaxID=233583 RepID=A0A510V4U6_9CELL|nr:class I SAM-dependent methyltransferase [Cellulomonas xylanilytica]GEK21899.1 SAM-dependent methyltransferase [Cellulomonas xylanilytica]
MTPDHLSGIARYWDAAAAGFDDEPDHGLRDPATRAAWASRLAGWLPSGPWDVLDLGCGTGSLSALLAQVGHRVTGVDVSPQMIERARTKLADAGLPATFVVGDAADPPGDPVDVVLVRHLVWTLPDPRAALARWVGLLRPAGTLVLVEGRWATGDGDPYVTDAPPLPWGGGVTAAELAATVAPLVSGLRVELLGDDDALWGGPVTDERYALVARL